MLSLLLRFEGFPVVCPLQTLKPLVFSCFHHLLHPAVHWRPIHLVMPRVTDTLQSNHTLSDQKITSPPGTPERNTTLGQGLTWQTSDHKPLLSEKENNCPTHNQIWPNQRQKRVIICGLPFHSFLTFPQSFYSGAIHCQEARDFSEERKAFLKCLLLLNNIQSEIHWRVCCRKPKASVQSSSPCSFLFE